MKKFFSLLAMMLMMAAVSANAQSAQFGIKGGLSNTSLDDLKNEVKNIKDIDLKSQFGWFIGPTLKVKLPLIFGADIAALYDQRQVKVDDQTIKMKSIIIPVNARANIPLAPAGGTGIYVAVGPQFGFNIGDDTFNWKDKENYESTFQLKKSSFSVNLGAGVYLLKHLEVGFAYNIALGSTADASFKSATAAVTDKNTYSEDDTKAKTWTISANIYF